MKWTKGIILAMYENGPGHMIFDTGWQLLTRCGQRVTWLGIEIPDDHRNPAHWTPVDRVGCFECQPSPLIEWTRE